MQHTEKKKSVSHFQGVSNLFLQIQHWAKWKARMLRPGMWLRGQHQQSAFGLLLKGQLVNILGSVDCLACCKSHLDTTTQRYVEFWPTSPCLQPSGLATQPTFPRKLTSSIFRRQEIPYETPGCRFCWEVWIYIQCLFLSPCLTQASPSFPRTQFPHLLFDLLAPG